MSTTPATPKACCTPTTGRHSDGGTQADITPAATQDWDRVRIPGGRALVGTGQPQIKDDGEGPPRKATVKPFLMGRGTVSNAAFSRFIQDTGYVTEAERFGWSFVFWKQVPAAHGSTQGVRDLEWWRRVDGANWRDIKGSVPAQCRMTP